MRRSDAERLLGQPLLTATEVLPDGHRRYVTGNAFSPFMHFGQMLGTHPMMIPYILGTTHDELVLFGCKRDALGYAPKDILGRFPKNYVRTVVLKKQPLGGTLYVDFHSGDMWKFEVKYIGMRGTRRFIDAMNGIRV